MGLGGEGRGTQEAGGNSPPSTSSHSSIPVIFFPLSAGVVDSSYFLSPRLLVVNSLFLNLGLVFIVTGPVWGNEMLNGTWTSGYEMFGK